MDKRKITRLGDVGYSRSIEPSKRDRFWRGPLVGFDTEYHHETRELLTYQMWSGDNGVVVPVKKGHKLTPLKLYHECIRLCGVQDVYTLIVYFSLAELQFLPVVTEGFNVREYGSGSVDVTFATKNALLQIFDLQRWFASPNQPLKKAAKSFGLVKLDFPTHRMTRKLALSKKGKEYGLNDAKIQWQIATNLRKLFMDHAGVDPIICKTPASASATALRKTVKRKLYNDNNRARLIAMRGTWGGHAEVFKRGKLKGPHTEWDFSSAYPASALALREMPVQRSWRGFRSLKEAKKMLGGFARAEFEYPKDCQYPCLPINICDSMVYPLQGVTDCTLEELRQAESVGARIRIVEGKGYSKGTTVLRDYLHWTLAERKKSTGGARHMWKLLGNSLIGKFAQCISKIAIDDLMEIAKKLDLYLDEVLSLTPDEQRNLSDLAGVRLKEAVSVGPVFMPEWNGLITGYTRAALAELISSGNAVYCHTDSAWCKGKKRPTCNRLKFEKKTSGPVTIARTRFASMGEKLSYARMKAGKVHVAHHSVWNSTAAIQMLSRFDGDKDITRKYPVKRPLKLRESIKSGQQIGLWVTEWRTASTKWDQKRRLHEDGTTSPWETVEQYLDALRKSGYKRVPRNLLP